MHFDEEVAGAVAVLKERFPEEYEMFPVADMIPSMVIVMPLSYFWVSTILPLVS